MLEQRGQLDRLAVERPHGRPRERVAGSEHVPGPYWAPAARARTAAACRSAAGRAERAARQLDYERRATAERSVLPVRPASGRPGDGAER